MFSSPVRAAAAGRRPAAPPTARAAVAAAEFLRKSRRVCVKSLIQTSIGAIPGLTLDPIGRFSIEFCWLQRWGGSRQHGQSTALDCLLARRRFLFSIARPRRYGLADG